MTDSRLGQQKGGSTMKKLLMSIMALMLVTFGWNLRAGLKPTPTFGQEVPAPRGELRVVNRNINNWASITFNVFEHLIEVDKDGKLVPCLATSWQWLDDRTLEFKLRQGVKFHNGEVFDAEIVKLNWEENTRRRQPHVLGQFMNFKPGSRLEILDPQTVQFIFPEPDGGALAKLILMHIGNRQFYRQLGWGEENW
jgi:peptide/nickel transport system substrate-binding protein